MNEVIMSDNALAIYLLDEGGIVFPDTPEGLILLRLFGDMSREHQRDAALGVAVGGMGGPGLVLPIRTENLAPALPRFRVIAMRGFINKFGIDDDTPILSMDGTLMDFDKLIQDLEGLL